MAKIGEIDVEWRVETALVAYPDAVREMEKRVADIHGGRADELVWLLEHPPLYTAGTSAVESDLLDPGLLPVFKAGRGGQYTYHGPGQRIAYVMVDLKRRGGDIRKFVASLEEWIITTLGQFEVIGERRTSRVGIWVHRKDAKSGLKREDKIAAIGVRIRHWITFHGIAINVEPDLEHFSGIVPCGIGDEKLGVTSLVDLGLPVTMADLDVALMAAFDEVFES
ncbi:MAG: lipoyl(octanoyl) transferase LipB [Rhodospirillaceae bacterium]|nr:lipoyl(octanoyl) transferase LipB [Rhodospirillaceae bacterium]